MKSWFLATRPWSFTASALSVLTVLAYLHWTIDDVDWLNGCWAVAAIVLFHAAGNTWSDWHDFRRGVDAPDAYSVDTLTSGRFTPAQVRGLSLGLFAVAVLVGMGLALRTGWTLVWMGLGGLLCAVCYPPLKYRALGDIVILLAYGLLPALGTSFVATGSIHWDVLRVAVPVGLLVDAILHANNTRDMRTDRRAGIRTLAHGLGTGGSRTLYVAEMTIPFAWVAALAAFGLLPLWSLAVLATLPLAVGNIRMMRAYRTEADAAAIAALDQRSAQLQMVFSLLLTVSLLI